MDVCLTGIYSFKMSNLDCVRLHRNEYSQTLNIYSYFYVSQLHVSVTSAAMATLRWPEHVVHCYTTEQNGDPTS